MSEGGKRCECGGELHVVDSRQVHAAIRRRVRCRQCKARFTTYEVRVDDGAQVLLRRVNGLEVYDLRMNMNEVKRQPQDDPEEGTEI